MKLIDLINVSNSNQFIKALFNSHGITAHATISAPTFLDNADEELLNMQVGFSFECEDGVIALSLEGEE